MGRGQQRRCHPNATFFCSHVNTHCKLCKCRSGESNSFQSNPNNLHNNGSKEEDQCSPVRIIMSSSGECQGEGAASQLSGHMLWMNSPMEPPKAQARTLLQQPWQCRHCQVTAASLCTTWNPNYCLYHIS